MYIDHLIIGGGISGIYIAMQLYQKNKPFIILDEHKKPHSKLETTKIDTGEFLEMGASIFHSKQYKLLSLIKFLGLQDKIKKLEPSSKCYVSHDGIDSLFQIKFDLVKAKVQEASKSSGLLTIQELAQYVLDKDEYNILKTGWDCWWENKDMNAYHFFSTDEGYYCKLEGGLKSLTRKAWDLWKDNLMSPYKVNSIDFDGDYIVTVKSGETSKTLRAKHIYICIGLEHLPSIDWHFFTENIFMYKSLGVSAPSIRYYILLNEPVDIDYDQIIGNVIGHWIIKISPTVYMIYTDGDMANYINSLSDTDIIKGWIEAINKVKVQPIEAKVVKRTIRGYWQTAFEVLLPKYYTTTVKMPFMITSLPTVKDQAWMNGHLYKI